MNVDPRTQIHKIPRAHQTTTQNAKSITHITTAEFNIKSQTKKKKKKKPIAIEIGLTWCSGLGFVGEGGIDVEQRERENREMGARMRDGRNRNEKEIIRRKERGLHLNKKNNISFTIGEQCDLKYKIALFINAKYYDI